MSALKNRGSLGDGKKGVKLLGIVKKLSAKRAALKEGSPGEEKGESPAKEAAEGGK